MVEATIAQYGGVGIAIVALGVILQIVREYRKEMMGVIDRNTDAHVKNAEATAALVASLPHVCKYQK